MSDELLKRADERADEVPYFGALTHDDVLIRDLAARIRELEAERLTHGNIMGRIAIALFSDQNNRTDEECVAAVAELSYERSGAIQRAKRAEADNERLRKIEAAARELVANVEEYDCDGLGLFAQHGWWEPLHEAMERADEADADDKKPA